MRPIELRKDAISLNQTGDDITTQNNFVPEFSELLGRGNPISIRVAVLIKRPLGSMGFAGLRYIAIDSANTEKPEQGLCGSKYEEAQPNQTVNNHTGTPITESLKRRALI